VPCITKEYDNCQGKMMDVGCGMLDVGTKN